MRKIERAQGEDLDRMVGAKSRKDLMFVRSAVSGGWRKELPMPMVDKMESAWGPVMQHLGYECATQSPSKENQYTALGIDFNFRATPATEERLTAIRRAY